MSTQLAACPTLVAVTILNNLRVGSTLGVLFIGIVFSSMLFGLTVCQCFYYYRSTKSETDHWFLKSLVASLMILATVQEGFIVHSIYYYFVSNYYNPCALLGKAIWSNPAQIAVNAFVDIIVEGFLIHRGWKLGRNSILTTICVVLVGAESALTLAYPIRLLLEGPVFDGLDALKPLGIATLGTAALADVCVTLTLVFYLSRSRTSFKRTNGLVTRLIVLTVSTGALTAIIVIADLIAYLTSTTTFYVAFFNFLIGKMYVNAMLTTLNTRGMMAALHSTSNTKPITSIPMFHMADGTVPRTQRGSEYPMEVTVEHTVEVDNGSQVSQDKTPELSNDRFVLSQSVFELEKRKQSV